MAERDDSPEVSGALAALLELEAGMAARTAGARQSSAERVAEARTAAEQASAHRDQERDESLRSLRQELDEAHRMELAAIEDAARTEADRFDSLDDPTIERLAAALVKQLLSLVVSAEPGR